MRSHDPQQQPQASEDRGLGWPRRLIPPLLMLIVAGGIFIYAQRQREQQAEDVRAAATALIEQAAQMPPGGAMPPMARQLQASLTTIEQLQAALEDDPQLQSLVIHIERGDAERPYGDGSATHQAHIELHGRVVITLRFLHPGDAQTLRLVGFWMP